MHDLGMCCRVLFSFCRRVPVPERRADGDTWRGQLNSTLCADLWRGAAERCGHGRASDSLEDLLFAPGQDLWLEDLLHATDVLLDEGGWGSCARGLLGKCEHVVGTHAALNHMMEVAYTGRDASETSDCAVKAAIRFFDLRMALGAAVIDAEVACQVNATPAPKRPMDQNLTAAHPEANSIGKVLRAVPQDPITYRVICRHTWRNSDRIKRVRRAKRYSGAWKSLSWVHVPLASHGGRTRGTSSLHPSNFSEGP